MFYQKLKVEVKLRGLPEVISLVSGNDAVQTFLRGVFIYVWDHLKPTEVPYER